MDAMEKRANNRKGPAGGGAVKNARRKNKNGMKIKEEKMNQVGPDPGGGGQRQNSDLGDGSGSVPTPKGQLQDDLMLNGSTDIKLENPSTPQLLDSKGDCNSDMNSLPDLGHPDFPDCKPPMNPYMYNHYNNMPPGHHSSMSMSPHPGGPQSGDYGPYDSRPPPPHPPMMGGTKQQPSTLEAQYMQQQSQIFVFSTQLANKAADAVCRESFPSIIAFHTTHPTTRKFLEVQGNPNWPPPPPPSGKMGKGSKGGQQSQSQMPPHMSMPGGPNMPPDSFPMHPGHPSSQGHPSQPHPPQGHPNQSHPSPPHGPPMMGGYDPDSRRPHPPQGHPPQGHPSQQQGHPPQGHNPQQGHPPPGPWNTHNPSPKQPQHGYPNYYDGPPYGGPGIDSMRPMGPGPGGPGGPMGPGGYDSDPRRPHTPGHPPHGMGPGPGRLTGVKVRDEDLTPEQRHHREEQLAKVRKLQEMFFPEHDHMGDPNCQPMPPHENLDGYNMPPGGPLPGPMNMDYMHGMQHGPAGGPGNKTSPNEWSSPQGGFFMDGPPGPGGKPGGPGPGLPGMGSSGNGSRIYESDSKRPQPLPMPCGNGPRGGSIPSPATPLTPGSSCGAPHRPSPHSPLSGGGDPLFPGGGHSFYPSGYYSPQVGQPQDNSPSAAVHRKDSESSNSEGGKSRKEKSSCSISPTSSAPPSVKEANLMPVPSPQQILYMNVFEGQELTIQKQPNVGLNDTSDNSPGMPPSSLEMNPSTPIVNQQQKPSLSAPPTPVSISSANNQKSTPEMVMTSNSSNSKTRPGSVGPVATPKSSTTPNPSPQGLDRSSQPGTPLQMNLGDMKPSNYGPPGNLGPGQPPCGMMKQIPMSLEYPDGPVGSVDNIPLNPDLTGPGPCGVKPVFDPISSMVQMSQSLGGNGTPGPNPQGSGMNSNGGYGGMNPSGGPPMNPNMVNFNTSMHNIQNVDGGLVMGGPQTVNNTYVNATMTIQQMNIQNIPPYMNQNMNPHQMPGPMGQQMGPIGGGGPMSSMAGSQLGPPPNMQNHPSNMNQMGPGGPGGPMGMMSHQQMTMNHHQQMSSMGICGMPPRGGGPPHPQMMYGNQPPRMPGQGVRGSPYRMPGNPNDPRNFGGTNIQVKPNAPNTIQYLPARPPPPHNQSQGPPCPQPGSMGPGTGGGSRQGPNLDFLQRYTNPSPGPVVNVNMGMNVNVMSGNRMPYPGPPMSGMGNNGPPPTMMRGQHSMMDQQGPGGSVGGPGGHMPNAMVGMKGPGGYPPGPPNGPPPQPENDPAYAQQFHNFQQQLYRTGTNNGRNPMPPNVQGNPNTPPNQFFK